MTLENVKKVMFKVSGMHCVSCAMNIDGSLEDLPGVLKAQTNYAKGETVVEYDEKAIEKDQLVKAVGDLGYVVN